MHLQPIVLVWQPFCSIPAKMGLDWKEQGSSLCFIRLALLKSPVMTTWSCICQTLVPLVEVIPMQNWLIRLFCFYLITHFCCSVEHHPSGWPPPALHCNLQPSCRENIQHKAENYKEKEKQVNDGPRNAEHGALFLVDVWYNLFWLTLEYYKFSDINNVGHFLFWCS